jgi:hypothetical protein
MVTILYVKTHNVTGLRYFGKYCPSDTKYGQMGVHRYRGSGHHWKRHIKRHGYDVHTEVIGVYEDKKLLVDAATTFSTKHNIVECPEWANLKPEDGLSGGSRSEWHATESRQKMSEAKLQLVEEKGGHHLIKHLLTEENYAKMRKPKQIRRENCRHCGVSKRWFKIEEHETRCRENPDNRQPCPVCGKEFGSDRLSPRRRKTCSKKCGHSLAETKRNIKDKTNEQRR